ncbi:succinic semialdehyde dehydrogenase [Streptomyces sp. NPDC059785]|uniref:succinic semialdehyde dehydrogenase n=1 Tax=unclassified Streptomyces TaxID=2593676 RepID=UPI00365D0B24
MTSLARDPAYDPAHGLPPRAAARLPGRARDLALLSAAPSCRSALAVCAPVDGGRIGWMPSCEPVDVGAAAVRARCAQADWARWPVAERGEVVLRFHDLLLERRTDVFDVIQAETGKARISAFDEFTNVALTARYYARSARRHLRPARRHGALPLFTRVREHHRPKGLVGVVSPWNYPFATAAVDTVPALLAGNAVLLKPSEQTPYSALLVRALLLEAGLPADLFQVLTGEGPVLGPPLVGRVDHLMFTGSVATGRALAAECARRLIGFSAELGGKNPLIVLADADLERAVRGALRACFANSGHLCVSTERIYVEADVHNRFLDAFVRRTRELRLATGPTWDADMGSLAGPRQFGAVARHVCDALAKGALLYTGGRARPDLGPYFYEPTVLGAVGDDMLLGREETFGPVVAVHRVRDAADALDRANDSRYGLTAAVFTTPARGRRLAGRLRTGAVTVNDGFAAACASPDAPMGGIGDSGVGRRNGREGIRKYTEPQTVAAQHLLPLAPPPGMPGSRYAALVTAGLKAARRLPLPW